MVKGGGRISLNHLDIDANYGLSVKRKKKITINSSPPMILQIHVFLRFSFFRVHICSAHKAIGVHQPDINT